MTLEKNLLFIIQEQNIFYGYSGMLALARRKLGQKSLYKMYSFDLRPFILTLDYLEFIIFLFSSTVLQLCERIPYFL